jgi:hypothetical protein
MQPSRMGLPHDRGRRRPDELATKLVQWRQHALEAPGSLVVAISATYGGKGSVIGPLLADRLGPLHGPLHLRRCCRAAGNPS